MSEIELLSIVKKCNLFSGLTEDKVASLLPSFEQTSLKKREILFSQGDDSDSLFVLVRGNLVSFLQKPDGSEKVLGMIHPGETIGELGVISGEPRSLTIRALSDAYLLRLPGKMFFRICEENPDISTEIMKIITKRSLKTIDLMSSARVKLVIFFKSNQQVSLEKFKQILHDQSIGNNIDFIDGEDPSVETVAEIIENSKHENHQIIIFVTKLNPNLFHLIDKQFISCYLVAQINQPVDISSNTRKILHYVEKNKIRLDLAFLHADRSPRESDAKKWISIANFSLYHHIHFSKETTLKRFIRFVIGKPVALVLGGGGVRGFCHLGVIKAMLEENVPIDIIVGTSAGSIVGGIYALTLDYEESLDSFTRGVVMTEKTVSLKNITWPLVSIFSGDPLTTYNQSMFGSARIENLPLPFYCISSNISLMSQHVHKVGMLWEAVRSSSAVPGIWPPMVINGNLHYDGGLLNQLPTDYMRYLVGSNAKIIASQISVNRQDTMFYNFPPALSMKDALLYKLGFKKHFYRVPQLLEIFFEALFLGSYNAEQKNSIFADIHIRPDLTNFGSFRLLKGQPQQLVEIGYREMKKALEKTDGFNVTKK